MNKEIILDREEKQLLLSFENDEWIADFSKERSEQLQSYAQATVQKNKKVNFRISELDLSRLQTRALREGIPYQTLISSVIHKFVNGVFDDKKA